jgi:acetyl esterase/lipase
MRNAMRCGNWPHWDTDRMNATPIARLIPLLLVLNLICGCGSLPFKVKAVRNLPYAEVNGKQLKLDLYLPSKPIGKLPVVVWIHGGGWDSGSKNFCPIAFLAEQNTAVASINYRLTQSATFPAPLFDCKGAVRWLRAHADTYGLDSGHIGLVGASAGGHLALLMATTEHHPELEGDVGGNLNESSRVQCVCSFYGPTDLNRLVDDPASRTNATGEVAKLIGGPVAYNLEKAAAASPITYVDQTCPPVYLLHGSNDTLVPPEQSTLFYEALIKAGVPAHLEIVPNKGHGITAPPAAAQEIFAFFDRYLRNGSGQ